MPIFIKKRPFSKNKLLSCAYFVIQTSILYKILCSDVIFFHNFRQKPLVSCPYLVKKNFNSAPTRLYYGPKSQRDAFFFDFSRNIHCSHSLILPKISKIRPLPQKHDALMSFFHENPHAVMPIFIQKNVNSVKTTIYYELKTSIGYSLFRFFKKNHCFHAHILSTKRPFSKKQCSNAHVWSKKR